jgi:hypothetical protein
LASAANVTSCEQTPAATIELKPGCDQAARLRAALGVKVVEGGPRVLVSGAKGGVGTTAIAAALGAELTDAGTQTVDQGRTPPSVIADSDVWVLVTTPEPAALAAAFDVLRSSSRTTGVTPLLVINRSPSFAASRGAFARLGEALAAVGSGGAVFAGHVPFDPVFARWGAGSVGGSSARRACRVMAGRFAAFLDPVVSSGPSAQVGAKS